MFCSKCLPLSPETLTQNIETILKLYNTAFFYNSYWTSLNYRTMWKELNSQHTRHAKITFMLFIFNFSARKSRWTQEYEQNSEEKSRCIELIYIYYIFLNFQLAFLWCQNWFQNGTTNYLILENAALKSFSIARLDIKTDLGSDSQSTFCQFDIRQNFFKSHCHATF